MDQYVLVQIPGPRGILQSPTYMLCRVVERQDGSYHYVMVASGTWANMSTILADVK